MSETDSLAKVEKDLREAVQFCLSSGLTAGQIGRGAGSLLALAGAGDASPTDRTAAADGPVSRRGGRASLTRVVLGLSLAVVIVALLLQNAWTFHWICVAGKTLQVKILPFWDWTVLYREECIISNPYYTVENKLTEDDCEVCQNSLELDVVENVSISAVADDYLFNNKPFIVTDATQDWKAFQDFTHDSLIELYTTNKVLKAHKVCSYVGNTTFAEVLNKTKPSVHSFWMNCNMQAVKTFRGFYKRPYFLPPMVESGTENFVAFSSGLPDPSATTPDSDFLECFISGELIWFAQIRGSYQIQLRPRAPCDSVCSTIDVDLQEGQTVVLTTEMWELWFARASDQPAIAIGSMGDWDS